MSEIHFFVDPASNRLFAVDACEVVHCRDASAAKEVVPFDFAVFPGCAITAELLRLADENRRLREEFAAELIRSAEEIRKLSEDDERADRDLFAQVGAALDCTIPAAILDPHFGGKPFRTSLAVELACAAFALRADRDSLAERVRELEGIVRTSGEALAVTEEYRLNGLDRIAALEAENATLKARVQEIEGGRLLEDALAEGSRLMAENAALRAEGEDVTNQMLDTEIRLRERFRREFEASLQDGYTRQALPEGGWEYLYKLSDLRAALDRILPEAHPTAPAALPEPERAPESAPG